MDQSADNGELPNRVSGLPVAGYRPQSTDAVASVNANKAIEERVLRVLDDLSTRDDVDKRWLAIGRTAIEQGFMAVNRAVFRPGRAQLPVEPAVETGWVIELASSPVSAPQYWPIDGDRWIDDHDKAMRFARELDAAAFVRSYVRGGVDVRICQHEWSS